MIVRAPSDCNDPDGDLCICDDESRVVRILNRNNNRSEALSKNTFLASGLQLINPKKILQLTGDNSYNNFPELWQHLIDKKDLYIAKTTPYKWCKIDTIEDWTKEIVLFSKGKSAYNI